MAKWILSVILVFLVLISLSFTALGQSFVDESLTINTDIGPYKYSKSPLGNPPLSEEDSRIIDKLNVVFYNFSWSSGKQTIVFVYVIRFKKLSGPEQFIEKIMRGSVKLTQTDYKGKIIYRSEGSFESLNYPRLWQSNEYIVFSIMGELVDGKLSSNPEPINEEVLDAYLEKYPVNYFKCGRFVYTQEMPPNGYQYVYDYDENGCESGRHLEPIGAQPTPYTIATPVAVPASGGQTSVSESRPIYKKCDDICRERYGTAGICGGTVGDMMGSAYCDDHNLQCTCAPPTCKNDGDCAGYNIHFRCINNQCVFPSCNYACQEIYGYDLGGECGGKSGVDVGSAYCGHTFKQCMCYTEEMKCTDPDRSDYFTKGVTCGYPRYPATDPMNCVVDKCERNTLIEYVINSDCVVGNIPYVCQNDCVDGACTSSENVPQPTEYPHPDFCSYYSFDKCLDKASCNAAGGYWPGESFGRCYGPGGVCAPDRFWDGYNCVELNSNDIPKTTVPPPGGCPPGQYWNGRLCRSPREAYTSVEETPRQIQYPYPERPPRPVSAPGLPGTGKVIEKGVQESPERIIEAVLKLETVRIGLEKVKKMVTTIADYYKNKDDKKYQKWTAIVSLFETSINKIDGVMQLLKSTRDVDGAKKGLAEIKDDVKTILDKILEAV